MTDTLSSPVRPEDEKAVRDIVARITEAWGEYDADKLATVYSEDASIVLPGVHLKGRPAIRDWMAEAFDGKWKGTKVLGSPLELRYIRDDVMLLLSQGGAYPPGAAEVPVEHAIRGIWVFVKQDGEWIITGYGNTPVRAPIPLPDGPR